LCVPLGQILTYVKKSGDEEIKKEKEEFPSKSRRMERRV